MEQSNSTKISDGISLLIFYRLKYFRKFNPPLHFSPKTPSDLPQRCTPLLHPAFSNLRRLIHLCAQACDPTTRGANLGTRARNKLNRPPVDNPLSVLVYLRQTATEGAPVPVGVADLFRGLEAHGVAFNGGGFVLGEFKVGGEKIGELTGGAVG